MAIGWSSPARRPSRDTRTLARTMERTIVRESGQRRRNEGTGSMCGRANGRRQESELRLLLDADANTMTRLLREVVTSLGIVLAWTSTDSCGSGCPLRLTSRKVFSSFGDVSKAVPCCGSFVFREVDLTSADIQQVDLANSRVNTGRVDAFLTGRDCEILFTEPYNGPPAQSRCKVFIGPVAPGDVSERLVIPRGTYRIFAQAWASNENANIFDMDVGVYSDNCRATMTAPGR
jgi:hypothetical protein